MAKGRNRNNQAGNRPEDIEETTDAEFLENDDQVDIELSNEEEQATMAKEPSQQDDIEVDEVLTKDVQAESDNVVSDESKQNTATLDAEIAKKKGSNAVWYGVGVVLVAAAVAGVYYSNQSDDSANDPSAVSQSVTEAETNQAETTEGSVDNESSTDLASSDDVIEHQGGEEAVEEAAELGSTTNLAAEEESSSIEERPAELSAIVSPELGIGAFEQEELATGEKSPEEVTTMDEPNAEMVDSSEVEVIESDALINTPSEDEVVSSESNAFAEEGAVELNQGPEVVEGVAETQALEAETLDHSLEAQAQQQLQAQAQAIAAVEEQGSQVIAELEREFEVLTARQQQEIHRLQQELSGMQQHLQESNASADSLLLNDVSRLLQSAENELRFNGNVANAVSILTVAQRIAAESKNKMLEGLVGAIGADIVSLKSSESATLDDMFRQVQQLSKLLDVAPLNTPDYASHSNLMIPSEATAGASANSNTTTVPETRDVAAGIDAKWYERTWTQTKSFANTAYGAIASDLGDLVRVEKLSEPDSGLLSAEQAGIMRNNLKMQLGFAQQALMSRQQGIWQTSLTTVAESLKQYFRQDSAETIQAQSMLAELVTSSVQPTVPDISHSRRALSETYEQLRVQHSFQE